MRERAGLEYELSHLGLERDREAANRHSAIAQMERETPEEQARCKERFETFRQGLAQPVREALDNRKWEDAISLAITHNGIRDKYNLANMIYLEQYGPTHNYCKIKKGEHASINKYNEILYNLVMPRIKNLPSQQISQELVVTTEVLNLRASPSLQANIISSLRKGQVVNWLESSNDGQWYKIRTSKLTGWAFGKYLTARSTQQPSQAEHLSQESETMLDPFAWTETHGAELAEDETFSRDASTRASSAYLEGEHLELGESVIATIDAWAMAGLIDGGAMIDVKMKGKKIAAPVDEWEIVVPDLSRSDAPYESIRPLSSAHWHYIVPDPIFQDTATQTRWTEASLRDALKQGKAAVLTFGQLVFIGGDWVRSFADLHTPFLYKPAKNLMEAVGKQSQLALAILDITQNGNGGYKDLKSLVNAAEGKEHKLNPNIDQLIAGFAAIRSAPFGPIHLLAQFMASGQIPLEWSELEKHATWLNPRSLPAGVRSLKVQERPLQILLTNGEFLELALHNEPHFYPDNWDTFISGYTLALDELRTHLANPLPAASMAPIPASVLARVGFSLHFLTDAFASGHMRVPRKALGTKAAIASKIMHDLDNDVGLTVTNGFPSADIWKAYGDGALRGPKDREVIDVHKLSVLHLNRQELDANYKQVVAAIAEAVLLLHYYAQHLRINGQANGFPMLDKARNITESSSPEPQMLGDDRAPSGPHFPNSTEWLTTTAKDIISYMRQHQPRPIHQMTGLTWPHPALNLPPLIDQNLNVNTSGIYKIHEKITGPRLLINLPTYQTLQINLAEVYFLAREASKTIMPGVPSDTMSINMIRSLPKWERPGSRREPPL